MSSQPVKRLHSLEIDEVSLVDRPANQHGLVTITKRDEGTGMGLYDENGQEVDETQLQSGDVVFNDNGEAIQLFSDEDLDALLQAGEISEEDLLEDDRELVGIGKAGGAAAVTGGPSTITRLKAGVAQARLGFGAGVKGGQTKRGSGYKKFGGHVGRNRGAYGLAAGATGAYVAKNAPSLGQEVLSELSKALTDGDQHQVISKVAERVETAERIAKAAEARAAALEDAAEFAQFVEVGKSFELPVDEEILGSILQTVSKHLSDDELEVFERILNTAASAIDLEERGSAGTSSAVMGYMGEAARELVGKSAGDLTPEQASTALFSANDEAYLAYLSENAR